MTTSETPAEAHAAGLLAALGLDCSGDLARTPLRMARALMELTAALREPFDPAVLLSRQFDPPAHVTQMVLLTNIPFTSVCEHHILPFHGTATVAYLPEDGAKIVGVSKMARLVEGYSARPQMQERLGQQIVEALAAHLTIQGAGCLLSAVHTCMTLRGPRAATARMTTSHLVGCFLEGPVRTEFLTLAHAGGANH